MPLQRPDEPEHGAVALRRDRAAIDELADRLLEALRRMGYPESSRFALRLAYEEAIANAFQHGAAGRPDAVIDVRWRIDPQEARVVVADHGPGFDPRALPDPTSPEQLTKPTGRGLLLMRAYTSELRHNDKGNTVTLILRPPHSSAGS